MGLSGRRGLHIAAAAVAVLLAGELTRLGGSLFRPAVVFDVGPSTADEVDGFTESEERGPVSFRWTTERATISLPLEAVAGPASLTLRYARFLQGSAEVRVSINGSAPSSFSARSGRFRTMTLPFEPTGEPIRIDLLVTDPDPARLGIAVDWVRIEGARYRLSANGWIPRLALLGTFLLVVASGLPLRWAFGTGIAVSGAQAIWLAKSPFAMAHVHAEIGVTGLVFAGLVALVVRERRWPAALVPLLFLLGLWLKGAALFHPSYFYPDVRLHRRHLEAFVAAEGNLVERGIAAQKAANTAYPRLVAGRAYVFPYSPLFYLPFTLLDRDPRGIEAAMKHAGLILAALEVPLVFLLGRFLLGTPAAVWAALLTVFLPPSTSRLLYAQWPTLAGHLLDLAALSLAARMAAAPAARRHLLQYGAAGLASCLTYVSSVVNLSCFTLSLALLDRQRALRLLSMWAGILLATVLLLYLPFAKLFFSEILPSMLRGGAEASPGAGVRDTLRHVEIFYGLGYPALALAGLARLRQRGDEAAFRFLAAFGASFLGLLLLRTAFGMFKDLKDLLYVGPFVALTTAVGLETLAARGRPGRVAAGAIAIGLAGFGFLKYLEYFEMHTRLAGLP